ncbi:MAG: tyrosine-type recombinase/integrase [Sphaerochaeta sp.]|jgi:integrase|nr:tyrosine-type recombinase/integrase [Sphaerochaeta sp.]
MQTVKETLTDEEIEKIREACETPRDIALIDFLLSTGIRVKELVLLNRSDIDFQERQCKVLGKGVPSMIFRTFSLHLGGRQPTGGCQ